MAARQGVEGFGGGLEPATLGAEEAMCRNIRTLFNFKPPATNEEIEAAALQFVRKISGSTHPSHANEGAFARGVRDVTAAAHRLLAALTTNAPPRNREDEARKAKERAIKRFGPKAA